MKKDLNKTIKVSRDFNQTIKVLKEVVRVCDTSCEFGAAIEHAIEILEDVNKKTPRCRGV